LWFFAVSGGARKTERFLAGLRAESMPVGSDPDGSKVTGIIVISIPYDRGIFPRLLLS
jgi:hypothetical protein